MSPMNPQMDMDAMTVKTPHWKAFSELGEEIIALKEIETQRPHIERAAAAFFHARATLWLSSNAYPLPGEREIPTLPDAPAPDLVQRAHLERTILYGEDTCAECPAAENTAHAAAIPLITNKTLLGVLQIERSEGEPFSPEEQALMEDCAAHIAAALEISRQERLKAWRLQQLELVRQVSAQVASVLNLDELCQRVTRLIRETFNYYYVALFSYEPSQQTLYFRADSSLYDTHPFTTGYTISPGEGLIGTCALKREQIIVPDVFSSPHYRPIDLLPETLSEACFPLKVEGELLGVMDVQSDVYEAFSETDILVLNALADNIAIAMQAARLYSGLEQRVQEISSVFEISHALNSILELDELLDEVVHLIQRRFGYPHISIFTVHPGRRLVIFQAGSGERSAIMREQGFAYPLDAEKGIIPWVARNGKTLLANDVNREPLYLPSPLPPENTGSELAIPVCLGEEVLAVLDLQSDEPNAFSEQHVHLFEAIAASLAIAYRNAILYRSEKWRRQVAESFRDIAYQISSDVSLPELLDNILTRLEQNLPCDASAIFLIEDEMEDSIGTANHPLRLAALHGTEPERIEEVLREHPEVQERLKALLEHPEPYIRTPGEPYGPLGYALNLPEDYSSIVAPLRAGNTPLGSLILVHGTYGRYGSEARSMTATFAGYAAVAIQNSRLYLEAQQEALISTMLLQIAEASQSILSMDELLETMLRLTRLLVGVRKCAFLFKDEDESFFNLRAWHGFDIPAGTTVRIPASQPALMQLNESRAPMFLTDPAKDLGLPEAGLPEGNGALLMLPLLVRGELLGIYLVTLQTQRSALGERAFDPKSLAILQGIAHQTSITVENLRLLEARQEEAYVTAVLLQAAQAVVSASSLDELLDSVVHLLPVLVGIDVCVIYLWDSEGQTFRPAAVHGENRAQERSLRSEHYPYGEHRLLDALLVTGMVHVVPIPSDEIVEAEDWALLRAYPLEPGASIADLPQGDWLLGFPLIVQGRVLGALLARERRTSLRLRERRLEIIHGIARQTSLAIHNEILRREMVQNERMEQEIRLARQIQETFLPGNLPSPEGWEIDVRWETARTVGGDFYDCFMLGENRIGLVVADVSDKGLPAALYMTVTRTLIRSHLDEHEDPARVLKQVNALLFSESPESMFITAVYAILDTASGEVVYANAGHNRPLVYRQATREVEESAKGGMALGVLPDLELENHTLKLDPGDAMLMFTDGAFDTLSPTGEDFGEERLREAFRNAGNLPAIGILALVDRALMDFRQGTPLSDDITLLVVRRTPQE
ncbi:GAF domain-containing protein [Anaerolinea sp.]|uniref:GAF domain-containing protein n=1 Tax=Anaerolinea sp. TaxID=1872519 RepID=UPI00263426DD|nr:GAF domain-containing protein [uncultured Anaerolinea sp.]